LHIFVPDRNVPTASKAAKVIEAFNQDKRELQTHVALSSFLTFNVVVKTLCDWWRLRSIWRKCQRVLGTNLQGRKFLPLMVCDWKNSFLGKEAMSNLLTLNMFEDALAQLPRQEKGVFLQENQGWEYGFIHAWRAANHGELIGFPHSSVRYWDLRFSFDERFKRDVGHYMVPMPDCIVANGPAAERGLRSVGYPSSILVCAEALRYLFLENFQKTKIGQDINGAVKVLIVGDYSRHHTYQQLRLLEQSLPSLNDYVHLTFKSHPACPIDLNRFPKLKMDVTKETLSDILMCFDVVYTSAVTSAAVDAYSAGLKVVTILDALDLNLSPLRGEREVTFVTSGKQLADALNNRLFPSTNGDVDNYFYTTNSLPRWTTLLLNRAVETTSE